MSAKLLSIQSGTPKTHTDDQAVLMYSVDHYSHWQAELGQEFPFVAFAENLTVSGLDENTVCIGDIYQIGVVKVQVAKPHSF